MKHPKQNAKPIPSAEPAVNETASTDAHVDQGEPVSGLDLPHETGAVEAPVRYWVVSDHLILTGDDGEPLLFDTEAEANVAVQAQAIIRPQDNFRFEEANSK